MVSDRRRQHYGVSSFIGSKRQGDNDVFSSTYTFDSNFRRFNEAPSFRSGDSVSRSCSAGIWSERKAAKAVLKMDRKLQEQSVGSFYRRQVCRMPSRLDWGILGMRRTPWGVHCHAHAETHLSRNCVPSSRSSGRSSTCFEMTPEQNRRGASKMIRKTKHLRLH